MLALPQISHIYAIIQYTRSKIFVAEHMIVSRTNHVAKIWQISWLYAEGVKEEGRHSYNVCCTWFVVCFFISFITFNCVRIINRRTVVASLFLVLSLCLIFLLCFAYYALCGALCVCLFDNELNPKFIGLGFNFLATSKNVMRIHKYRVVCLRDGNSISRISMIKFQSPLNRLAPLHNYKHACMCVCVNVTEI